MISPSPLPPKEAIAYWQNKVPMRDTDFSALEGIARDRAFAVTGLSKLDQITTIQNAIRKALENGETIGDFKGRISDIIETQGWTEKRSWRVDNIYRTNIQSAYMAGRWRQMQRTTKARPYWKLIAVKDSRTRKSHIAVDGLVFRHDHPFWDTWYPPNGFRCRCIVVTLSERQVKARGLEVQTEIPDRIRLVDPDTGAESFVTPTPDKGWARNIGRDWMSGLSPYEASGTVVDLPVKPLCRGGEYAKKTCTPPLSGLDQRHILQIGKNDILTKGLKDEEYVRAFLSEFGVSDINGNKVHRLPGNIPVLIDKNFFVIDKRTGTGWKVKKNGREQFVKLLARTILDPYEIWQTTVQVAGRNRPCLNLLRLFADANGTIGGYGVFHLIGRTWSAATAFPPQTGKSAQALYNYLEKKRNGVLVYREP